MGYYYNFELNGFTTQEGTGDASPNNVRKIKNAGEFNKLMKINGDTSGLSMSSVVPTRVVVPVSDAIANQNTLCDLYASNRVSQTDKTCYIDSSKNFGITDSRFTSLDEAKRILSEHPVTFVYLSTENTGKFYTGIEITQGDEYRCEIIELQDLLHEGDKVETNVQSEYDKTVALTGNENYVTYDSWVKGAVEISNAINDAVKVSGYDTTADILCSALQVNTPNNVTSASNTIPSIGQGGTGGTRVFLYLGAAYNTVDLVKQRIKNLYNANTPIRIFYKSASGGTGKNIRRETHVKGTLVLTGQENVQADPSWRSGVIAVLQKMADAVQVDGYGTVANITCSHLKVDTPNGIASNGLVACGQGSGNKLFLCFGSQYNTTELAKEYLAQQYAAGTPVTVEYDLATPEVFVNEAIEPVYIKALQSHSFSGEEGTNLAYTRTSKFIEPKTNWRDLEFFNLDPDYSRIKADIEVIKEYTDSLYPDVSITNMPKEYSISDDIYSEVPNNIVKSIEQIRSGSITPDGYAQMITYIDGQPAWNANELNTIENNVRLLYNMFVRQEEALQKLPVMLGIRGIT